MTKLIAIKINARFVFAFKRVNYRHQSKKSLCFATARVSLVIFTVFVYTYMRLRQGHMHKNHSVSSSLSQTPSVIVIIIIAILRLRLEILCKSRRKNYDTIMTLPTLRVIDEEFGSFRRWKKL